MYKNLLLESFFNLSEDFLVVISLDGYFKKINSNWLQLGYSERDLLSSPFISYVHPDDREKTERFLYEGLIPGKADHFENRFLNKNGESLWFSWNFTKVENTEYLLGIAKDLTEQKRLLIRQNAIDRDLRAKNKQLEDLFEMSQDLIVIANADGYFKKINPKWIEVLGYTESEILSKPFIEFIHPDDRHKTSDMVQQQKDGFIAIKFENRYVTKGGESIWLEWNGTAIDGTGDIFAIARNVTISRKRKMELEVMLKEVKAKNRQLEDFAYITSHNLRSPVANIFVLAKFLEESDLNEDQSNLVKLLKDSTETLNHTLEDLVEIVQINNQDKILIKRISLEETCNEVLKQLSGAILSNNVEILTDFESIDFINYSEVFLKSIFLNLISNSIKYKSPVRTPVIHITSRKLKNNSVQLTFSDNGLGIDLEKHHNKIFGFRKTFHNHPDSKGVGLYMTKSQVEALNGTINISSKVNKGTTFTINIAS